MTASAFLNIAFTLGCAFVCSVALGLLARRAPERNDFETESCPPVDADTELRRLIERGGRL